MLIIGPSGTGKTILLLKLLLEYLDYDNLILCSPSLAHQDEYQIFIEGLKKGLSLEEISQIFQHQDEIECDVFELMNDMASIRSNTKRISITIYTDPSQLPMPEKIKEQYRDKKTIIVLDDCMLKNQESVENLWVYGRPLDLCSIYLTQSFFAIDKQAVRDNTNVFIFFEVSDLDLKNSYYHIAAKDFETCEEYREYAKKAFSSVRDSNNCNRGYFVVDRTKPNGERFKTNLF